MKRKTEKGAVVAFLAVILPVMIGMLGLGADGGAMFELKRRAQTAADFGALAGAHEVRRDNAAKVVAAATYDAKRNGFEADADTATSVTVNRPPLAGRFKDDTDFVEVIVEERAPLFFMSAFMEEGYLVRARAVASARPGRHCTYALNPDDRDSFNISGTAEVTFEGCAVQVNSSDDTAARTNGGGTVVADSIDVVGEAVGDGFSPPANTGVPPQDDPLTDLNPPVFSGCDHTRTRINQDATLNPGVYCKGLDISGPATVTLNPGTYVIDGGGVTVNAGTTVIAHGVTFYITASPGNRYGAFTVNGGTIFEATAPTSGPLAGILLFEDRELTNTGDHKLNGGSGMSMVGALYTKNATIKVAGDFGGEVLEVMIVADKVDISGTPTFRTLAEDKQPKLALIPRIVE